MRLSLAPLATLVVTFLPFLADAQPKNPLLNVVVTNTPLSITALTPLAITASAPLAVTASAPLLVTLVSPAVAATVTCSWDLGSGSNNALVSTTAEKGTPLSSSLKCPPNTAAIDVQRVIFDPYGGSLPSINVASYTLTVAIGTFAGLGGSFTNVLTSVPNPSNIHPGRAGEDVHHARASDPQLYCGFRPKRELQLRNLDP